MPKLAHRSFVRRRLLPQIDPHELPHHRRVIQGLFHRRVRQIEPLLQEIHTQHTFHSPPVAARSQVSDSVALSARTARATGQPVPSLPETPLVVSFLCTAQNHSWSPESFVVCLSISSGGNLLYIPVERETLFRVSLGKTRFPQVSKKLAVNRWLTAKWLRQMEI